MKPSTARNIDIFSAFDEKRMRSLKDWSDYDISEEIQQRIGIKEVKDAIYSELIKLEIKNFFFEFSLLPSVLDPTITDKLVCMSYCSGDSEFNARFGVSSTNDSAYETAIDSLVNDRNVGISIYQYPTFLQDIGFDKELFKTLMKEGNVEEDYSAGRVGVEEYKDKVRSIIKQSRKNEIEDIINISCIEPKGFSGREICEKSTAKVKAILMDRRYKKDIVEVAQDYYRSDYLIYKGHVNRKLKYNSVSEIHSALHKKISQHSISARVSLDQLEDDIQDNTRTYYVSFPVLGTMASNQIPSNRVIYDGIPEMLRDEYHPLQGIGACFIFFEDHENNLGEEKITDIRNKMIKVFEKVNDLVRIYSANYIFNLGLRLQAKALMSSLKSAKAAIMSRNMSHNLGSHVMAYLKQHLNSVRDMIRDNVLSDIFLPTDDIKIISDFNRWKAEFEQRIHDIDGSGGIKEFALPFLVGLGKFISYLQERQDFIATIATDYIPYLSAVNFKDFIYDELNPDLRYERHRDRIGMKPDNILLGNIARSEGLARATMPTKEKIMSDIVLKFGKFDGHVIDTSQSDYVEKEESLERMRNLSVALPGGVVGRQAIFSIIENVIRNAAKHAKWGIDSNQNLELTFEQYDKYTFNSAPDDDNLFPDQLSLREFLNKYYSKASDILDLYVFTLTDNMAFESGTQDPANKNYMQNLAGLEKAIMEPYIESSGEMVNSNKGIKEMRISSAWLRHTEDVPDNCPYAITNRYDARYSQFWRQIDGEDYWVGSAPILMARASRPVGHKDGHLQYIFCLEIPKMVALVTDLSISDELLNNMRSHFWVKYDISTFINERNKSYEFILIDDINVVDNERYTYMLNELRQVSPNRIVYMSQIDLLHECDKEHIGSVMADKSKEIEEEMYRIIAEYKDERILISDHKTYEKYKSSIPELVDLVDGGFGKYIYRTHHETEIEFLKFMLRGEELKDNCFVEGITGNNSTDRLVRNDLIDNVWVYKHLHAMKTSVAVFDERIFSKIYKKDEMDIISDQVFKPLTLPEGKDEKSFVSNYVKRLPNKELVKKLSTVSTLEELNASLMKIRENNFVFTDLNYRGNTDYLNQLNSNAILGDYMAIAYEMKGVSIFNLIKVEEGLDIYGYAGRIQGKDAAGHDRYYSIITKLGEIRQSNEGKVIINTFKDGLKFDYVSIHQGLLDKIYEFFNIKRDARGKHEFTKLLYETFASRPEDVVYYSDMNVDGGNSPVYYLPNLRIHSGRSKPSFSDMPQHQPFIQYAAIEHAVMDCKYSLVELLEFARYE